MMFRRKTEEEPKIDMTPMVDVVFLLLIFFMISTTFVENPGINIDLPDSASEVSQSEPRETKLFVDPAGELYLDQVKVTLEELPGKLADILADQPEAGSFVLMADQQVRHGLVVTIMDIAQQAGYRQLAIGTEKKPAP